MKAMIFAAGLGTRLRPLTNDRPKALVEVGGKSLLEIVIKRLQNQGVQEFVVNIHHFADKVIQHLKENENFGSTIHLSDERDLLLDTGGALKKARHFFENEEAFIVHNVDILSDLDVKKMYLDNLKTEAIASLAVRNRATSRYLLFGEYSNKLVGWKNIRTEEIKWSQNTKNCKSLAFSGISIYKPEIFNFMPSEAVFSIIPVLLEAAKTKIILDYQHDNTHWLDVGKKDTLPKAEKLLDILNQ